MAERDDCPNKDTCIHVIGQKLKVVWVERELRHIREAVKELIKQCFKERKNEK